MVGKKASLKKSEDNVKKGHKTKKSLKIVRTTTGALKRNSRFTGFIKASMLSHSSTRDLQKLGAKRKGKHQLMKEKILKIKAKVDKTKVKPKDEEEDEIQIGNNQRGFFEIMDDVKISPEDELILEQFKLINNQVNIKKKNNKKQEDLTQKIANTFTTQLQNQQDQEIENNYFKNPKILLVYNDVAQLLKVYRSGKLPQPFHVIPTVGQWQDLLKLTEPEEWSPQALNAATKIFSSSMDNDRAEYFYREIILPAVRKNILEEKHLNYHFYNALIKALYKPQAWIKGILFELCKQEDVTLKEAQIIGSILHKHSVPAIHGSIIIYKLIQFPFTGFQAVLLKVMIEKKYSLPQKVLNEVVSYFLKFSKEEREMPVIWHQTLLRFCELYQVAFTDQQKDKMKYLITQVKHYLISPEILKTLIQKQYNKTMEMEK